MAYPVEPMHDTEPDHPPGPDRSDLLTRQVNAAIKSDAVAEHVAYVDIYTPFKGKDGDIDDTALLAPDGDHPSQAGHRVIANALAAVGYSPLD